MYGRGSGKTRICSARRSIRVSLESAPVACSENRIRNGCGDLRSIFIVFSAVEACYLMVKQIRPQRELIP